MSTDDTDAPAESGDELTFDDVIYWMGWMMDAQRRTYDVQLAILAALGPSGKAKELQQLHERGEFLYPPAYARQDKDETPT